MEEVNPLSSEHIRLRNAVREELFKINDDEEKYWHKRCHETWLLKGDNNTKYFQKMDNGRKRKQSIFYLQDGEINILGDENLLNHATEYYKGIFGPGTGDMMDLDANLWPDNQKVTAIENEELITPFTEIEIKNALFQVERNKAVGPDWFTIEFYQVCWDFIK
jgi:hypothetical protein